jgi:uncharacterized protein YxjI
MLNYPLEMSFKILAINPQVRVVDATGQLVAYVQQKAFRLKEDITIFADEAQTRPLYRLKASRILDFNANYAITTPDDRPVGAVYRPGARSIWKANYTISDASGNQIGLVHEENPWIKVIDSLAGELPVVGMFSGYFFNPAYFVDLHGQTVYYLKKQPAFLEGKFILEKRGDFPEHEEGLAIAGTIMALMLERMRG